MPVLVKSSFTEALLVVLKCTDAINPFGRNFGCIALLSQYSPASMMWNASSMTVILCTCATKLLLKPSSRHRAVSCCEHAQEHEA